VQEINLYDLMRYYAKNWLNLLGAVILGVLIGTVYTTVIQTPLYKSEATMIIIAQDKAGAAKVVNINNYAELFKSRLVLEKVIHEKGYIGDYQQLLARTTATTDAKTDILRVSIADTDPNVSQTLVNAAVATFKDRAQGTYNGSENITTVDSANLPYKAENVRPAMQISLATFATFFMAVIALFFVYDYKNSTPKRTVATKAAKARTTKKPTPKQKKSAKA